MASVRWIRVVLIVLLCVGQLSTVTAAEIPGTASSVTSDPDYAPLIDSVEADYLRSTENMTRYEFDGRFTPAGPNTNARIEGSVEITYWNHTGASLDALYLRLYPNAPEYAEGELRVIRSSVDGESAPGAFSHDDTLYSIPLDTPVGHEGTVRVSVTFETVVPTDPRQSYGMFQYDSVANTYALAHWLPLLAGWDAEIGWHTGPISVNGDPVFTEAAVFDVDIAAPPQLVLVASGSLIDQEGDDDDTLSHFASGPSRDFVMAASTNFAVQERQVGETTVRSYALPGSRMGATRVLESGARALEIFNELIGLYPYEELDLVQIDIGNGAGGVEFSGLVYIGADFYDGDEVATDQPGFLEFIVVHEVVHQWFYGVVGNNQYQHAFMDESLANYLSTVFYAVAYDADEANRQANLHLRLSYFDLLFEKGDQVVDQPTDDFPTMRDYGRIIYGKGALAFMELRREIGTDAFFAGLRQYYEDFAFDVAQPDDLKAAFEEAAGNDLDQFWTHWFEEAAGAQDFDATDLARLLRELDDN